MKRYLRTITFLSVILIIPGNAIAQSLTKVHIPQKGHKLTKIPIKALPTDIFIDSTSTWNFESIEKLEGKHLCYYDSLISGDSDSTFIESQLHQTTEYSLSGDSLYANRFYNKVLDIKLDSGALVLKYPLLQGDSVVSIINGNGIYGQQNKFRIHGKHKSYIKKTGKLLIKSRIYENAFCLVKEQTIHQSYLDTTFSARQLIYTWYSNTDKYPLIEKVDNYIINQDTVSLHSTQCYLTELDDLAAQDEEERKLLVEDSLSTDTENQIKSFEIYSFTKKRQKAVEDNSVDISDADQSKSEKILDPAFEGTPFTECIFYPNPVVNTLSIRYTLSSPAKLRFSLYNTLGFNIYNSKQFQTQEGQSYIQIPMSNLHMGIYVLNIEVDGLVIRKNIQKK